MRLDPNDPTYGTPETRRQDNARIAKFIGSPKSRNYKTKLKSVRPARADDGGLEPVGESNTIAPAFRIIQPR